MNTRLTRATTHIAVAAVTCLATFGLTGTVAHASAEPLGSAQCLSGEFCLWGLSSYTGAFWGTTSTTTSNTGIATAHSAWNRTSHAARVYSGANGAGSSVCIPPGAQYPSTTLASSSARLLAAATC